MEEQQAKRSKSEPRYDKELRKFRSETLRNIEKFRTARADWVQSFMTEAGVAQTDSTTYFTFQIDPRRAAIISKLGFKLHMIRPHRKTVRPRWCFTMRTKITIFDYDGVWGKSSSTANAVSKEFQTVIVKDFKKRAASVLRRIAQHEVLAERKRKKRSRKKRHVPYRKRWKKIWQKRTERRGGATKINEYEEFQAAIEKETGGESVSVEDTEPATEIEVVDDAGERSKEAFQKVLKNLEESPKYVMRGITDAEHDQMKNIWDSLLEELKEKLEKRERLKKERGPIYKRMYAKIRSKLKTKGFKLKFRKLNRGRKSCKCQIVKGDDVYILKSTCDCGIQCRKNARTEGEGQVEGDSALKTDSSPPKDVKSAEEVSSSHIGEKTVDSLDIMRSRVASAFSRSSKDSSVRASRLRKATPSKNIEKIDENEMKTIYVSSSDVDSYSSVDKKAADEEEQENIFIENIKTYSKKNRNKVSSTDEPVQKDTYSKDSLKKVLEARLKPWRANTWSDISGRIKRGSLDEVSYSDKDVQPSTSAGKRANTERAHVKFDVSSFISGNHAKEGQEKKSAMKTVMSVVNILWKHK